MQIKPQQLTKYVLLHFYSMYAIIIFLFFSTLYYLNGNYIWGSILAIIGIIALIIIKIYKSRIRIICQKCHSQIPHPSLFDLRGAAFIKCRCEKEGHDYWFYKKH